MEVALLRAASLGLAHAATLIATSSPHTINCADKVRYCVMWNREAFGFSLSRAVFQSRPRRDMASRTNMAKAGNTPLLLALFNDRESVVEVLLNSGCNIAIHNRVSGPHSDVLT